LPSRLRSSIQCCPPNISSITIDHDELFELEWQSKTEWHRVVAFNRLGESIADTLHKGDHVLVDGQLVSSKYEGENAKPKKANPAKVTVFWSVRANSVRRLSRAEAEAPTQANASEPGAEASEAPF
jgi:single-stranded DNA-binding protein